MFQENIFLNKNVDTSGLSICFTLHILCVLLIDDWFVKNNMLNILSCQTKFLSVVFPKFADLISKQITALSVTGPRLL